MPCKLTKLNRPRPAGDILPRERLSARLDQGRGRPLTLVSAPAGYGKTTLVSRWVESGNWPTAWISLDESDNDLGAFLSYVLMAVETIYPNACDNTHSMVDASQLPPLHMIVKSLSNELHAIEPAFRLVLDDYYRINNPSIHKFLNALLRHPPESMHLVIISRYDPPLAFSSFRARDLMTEIRTRELRFTDAETAAFITARTGFELDADQVAVISAKSEGWVTGLHLLLLALKRQGQIDRLLKDLPADTQYAREYLFEEVLARQSTEVQQMLMCTALFERFCAPLCEALVPEEAVTTSAAKNGWEFIAKIRRENLFVVSLDTHNRWFRYHHVFQKLLVNQLQRRLSPEAIIALHRRASAWFRENGLIEESLIHALKAGDEDAAAATVSRFGHDLMNDQKWARLKRWLGMLTPEKIEVSPQLHILKGWLCHIQHDLTGVIACADRVETLLESTSLDDPDRAAAKGHLDALRAMEPLWLCRGEEALALIQNACEMIPRQHRRALVFAHAFKLGAQQMLGNLETGLSDYLRAMQHHTTDARQVQGIYLGIMGLAFWIDADLTTMRQIASQILQSSEISAQPEAAAYAHYFIGVAHYHRNELKKAEENLTLVVRRLKGFSHPNYVHSAFALASTYQAQSLDRRALEIATEIFDHAMETGNRSMQALSQAFLAELALHQGREAEAFAWAGRFRFRPLMLAPRFYMPQLTFIKTMLTRDTPKSRHQAADRLEEFLAFLKSIHNRRFQIDALALQAILQARMGQTREAHNRLEQALGLAAPGGFIRPFADLGPPMAELLRRFASTRPPDGYMQSLLSVLDEDKSTSALRENEADALLSDRELEILTLLARRLRNKEIAAALFISPETVKKHLYNIYKKLGVKKRRQAVVKAETLGIITKRSC